MEITALYESYNYGNHRCPKYGFCPESHILLSMQIGYFMILLPSIFVGVYAGFQSANRALDRLERGDYTIGVSGFLISIVWILLCGGLPWLGYWIAFEGGLGWLLG